MPPDSATSPGNHDHHLRLHDGRQLAYTDLGDSLGHPLQFGHGMPGCRLEGQFLHAQAQRHGFRVITPDRPGSDGRITGSGRPCWNTQTTFDS
ncbi:alpha/beta fold hydrolase [Marinobacter subterrani]|uniref:Alpha/beta hydrolase family n=1 Tax=Marinobacter subterrani TaxID=1658765 RepID=A0A0J7JDE7_9GAMM|nr:hypothetical protein [Marinobacter subterrani]KMQ75831.1 hypothetical protein Msub_12040 [Marinobacter subterrani]